MRARCPDCTASMSNVQKTHPFAATIPDTWTCPTIEGSRKRGKVRGSSRHHEGVYDTSLDPPTSMRIHATTDSARTSSLARCTLVVPVKRLRQCLSQGRPRLKLMEPSASAPTGQYTQPKRKSVHEMRRKGTRLHPEAKHSSPKPSYAPRSETHAALSTSAKTDSSTPKPLVRPWSFCRLGSSVYVLYKGKREG